MCSSKEPPVGRLIYFLAQDIRKLAERILSPHDLTLEQFHLLKNMHTDSGMTQKEIGEIASKTPANITRILDRLEAKGLVVRRADPDDRRAYLVFLTSRGKALLEEVKVTFESFSAGLHKGISAETQATVRDAVAEMTSNIGRMWDELRKSYHR